MSTSPPPPTPSSATLLDVEAYLGSQSAQERVRAALSRRRLPSAFDADITETVAAEARRFLLRGGVIGSAAGWCNARISARAIDLSRGLPARVRFEDAEHEGSAPSAPTPISGTLAEVRRAVLDLPASPEERSAALTFVTLAADDATLDPACPQPVAGATAQDAAIWAGLWYARRTECFGSDDATRRRRSRAAARVRGLLTAAHREASRG